MPTIDLNASGFEGRRRSLTVLTGGKGWATCRTCGSTLYPSRRESSKFRTVGGSRLNVEKFRCRCGRGHEVRRAAA
jgi:hypothetical protein